jgi:hypothetical protein
MFKKPAFVILALCALTQAASLQQPKPAVEPAASRPAASTPSALSAPEFAALIEKVSEADGYFDTDNLISNESSYLHVMGRMRKMNVSGGAFIGVGPDQSFSYIAQIRPAIAFMTDVRRDNLLQHLWFKSLFALARNRADYLCLMFGKPAPADLNAWESRGIEEIVAYLDKTPAKRERFDKTWADIQGKLKGFGLPLAPVEMEVIKRIHTAFFDAGLDLKFTSRNRGPRPYYPSYRDLLLEKDLTGKACNYLVSEDDFKFLQSLQQRNLIVPAVGNLAGGRALKAIAAYLNEKNERVSAFYTSNVEFYLMRGYREEDFARFAENVTRLPRDGRSVIIRSYFNGSWGYAHPQTVSGYYSTQLLQTMDSFVREYAGGGYESYSDLVAKHLLDLR